LSESNRGTRSKNQNQDREFRASNLHRCKPLAGRVPEKPQALKVYLSFRQ
jgi:hypothetical protein